MNNEIETKFFIKFKEARKNINDIDKSFSMEIEKLKQQYKSFVLEQAQSVLLSNPELDSVKIILNSYYNDQGGNSVFLSLDFSLNDEYKNKIDKDTLSDLSSDFQFSTGSCLFGSGEDLPEQTVLYILRKTTSVKVEEIK